MNDIDNMPSKCQSCPYWEACEYPYICDDIKPKQHENGNLNAEFAENPQNRPTDELIRKQDAIDALPKLMVTYGDGSYPGDDEKAAYDEALVDAIHELENLPPVQPDEKLEKCRFEYINACRIVTNPTPDTTKKDISDAYAVIKVLQPIFGDVTF